MRQVVWQPKLLQHEIFNAVRSPLSHPPGPQVNISAWVLCMRSLCMRWSLTFECPGDGTVPEHRLSLQHDGPNHLGLCCNALQQKVALITSDLWFTQADLCELDADDLAQVRSKPSAWCLVPVSACPVCYFCALRRVLSTA